MITFIIINEKMDIVKNKQKKFSLECKLEFYNFFREDRYENKK